MIRIGKRILLQSFPQLQIPKGEIAEIDVDVYGWKFKLSIEFKDYGGEQQIRVQPNADGVRLVFEKWNNSLGTALREPAELAGLSVGGTLEFLASNYRVGDTNLFSLQLLHNQEGK